MWALVEWRLSVVVAAAAAAAVCQLCIDGVSNLSLELGDGPFGIRQLSLQSFIVFDFV